ncbi:TRAP transporter substrate-binding protein DctP [Hoeflea alexandrii]|uniref:TRAP transporter substrate-binding protein DctP n=1 Tax=Hoeflea alexandrii TaxID=288436 RepID=UPI0022B00763|nr:TRAP transporter substrate-binding protein DctP [Hoeflea alexandrii]MCZ4291561.1 TRAP transporter substrate-binding protein DctP [Hoeflea alexandrii]
MIQLKIKGLVAAVAFSAMFAGAAASADTTWTYSSWLPSGHRLNDDGVLAWAADVEKVTEGRVKIVAAPKVVGTVPAQYDVIRDGLAEVGLIVPGYTPGRFDLISIGEGPFLTDRSDVAAPAFAKLYEKWLAPLNMFEGVHVASAFVTSPGHVFTKNPIKTVEDFKGLKLRSPLVGTIATIEALGAVPVQKSVSETYEMLSAGALDGSLAGIEQAKSFHLADVTENLTIVPGALFNSALLLVVNQAAWDGISAADQAAITEISGAYFATNLGKSLLVAETDGIEEMKAKGKTVTRADDALTEQIRVNLEPQVAVALEKYKTLGLTNAEEVLKDYKSMISDLEKELGK